MTTKYDVSHQTSRRIGYAISTIAIATRTTQFTVPSNLEISQNPTITTPIVARLGRTSAIQ